MDVRRSVLLPLRCFTQTDEASFFYSKEEVYYFRSDPRAVGAEVLLTVDPDSFDSSSSFFSDAFLPLCFVPKADYNSYFMACRFRKQLERSFVLDGTWTSSDR